MKILSKKTWEKLEDQKSRLTKQILAQQHELKVNQDTIFDLSSRLEYLATQIDDKNKELKRLKTLLTKNKIAYKKEEK